MARFSEAFVRALERRGMVATPPPAPKSRTKPKNAREAMQNAPAKAPEKAVKARAPQKAAPTTPRKTAARKSAPGGPGGSVAAKASAKAGKKQVDYADLFHELLATYAPDLLPVEAEYVFAAKLPEAWRRKFRFDAAWPNDPENPWAGGVAVEIDGGHMAFGGGRHGSDTDRDKLNLAAVLGWLVIRLSPGQLKRDPLTCFEMIRLAQGWAADITPETAPDLPKAWTEEQRKLVQADEKARKQAREQRKQTRLEQGLLPIKAPAKRARKAS